MIQLYVSRLVMASRQSSNVSRVLSAFSTRIVNEGRKPTYPVLIVSLLLSLIKEQVKNFYKHSLSTVCLWWLEMLMPTMNVTNCKNHKIDKTTLITLDLFFPCCPLSSHRYSNRVRVSNMVLLACTWCKMNRKNFMRVIC